MSDINKTTDERTNEGGFLTEEENERIDKEIVEMSLNVISGKIEPGPTYAESEFGIENACGFSGIRMDLKRSVFFVAHVAPLDLIPYIERFAGQSYAWKALVVASRTDSKVIPLLKEKLSDIEGQMNSVDQESQKQLQTSQKVLRKTLERFEKDQKKVGLLRGAFRKAIEKLFPLG